MSPPTFRLHTLGRLALVAPDGVPDASLGTRRRKLALLAMLALSRRPLSRDALVELFWGDQMEERARHSLSDALSHLRRTLGPGSITTRRAEVELAADAPIAVDALELAAAAAAGRWGEVIALYGGPFLDAVHVGGSARWEQWVDGQRATLEAHFITACRLECERLAASGDHARRAEIAERWLAVDPLSSPAAEHRLAALAADGTREGDRRALAAFEALERQLRTEFDEEPHDAVAALARAIATRATDAPRTPADPPSVAAAEGSPLAVPARRESAGPAPRTRRGWYRGWRRTTALVAVAAAGLALLALSRHEPPEELPAAALAPFVEPLGPTTTNSLPALVRYNEALLNGSGDGARERTIALLEEAVAIDSTFALALHRLGVLLSMDVFTRDRVVTVLAQAVRHGHRLSPAEHQRVLGSYHTIVTADYARAARAYRDLLALEPDDATTWHDLGTVYQYLGDEHRAATAYERALRGDRRSIATWTNLIDARYATGDVAGARRALDDLADALPGHPGIFMQTAAVAGAEGDLSLAERQLRALLAATPERPRDQAVGHMLLAGVLWAGGRVDEGDAAQRTAIALDRARGEPVSALQNEIALARATVWLRHDTTAARAILGAALAAAPLDGLALLDRPYLDLAAAWALAGDARAARALVAEYERAIPEHARRRDVGTQHLARGTIALVERRHRDAVAELGRAAGPLCTVRGLPELGLAYERLGQRDSAHATYERYVSTPSLRRADTTDPFHRQWVAARLQALDGQGTPRRAEELAAGAR